MKRKAAEISVNVGSVARAPKKAKRGYKPRLALSRIDRPAFRGMYRSLFFPTVYRTVGSSGVYSDAYAWELSSANAATLSALLQGFDEYRIMKIVTYIQLVSVPSVSNQLAALTQSITNNLTSTATVGGLNAGNSYPRLWYVHDFNDAGGMALTDIQAMNGVKFMTLKPDSVMKIVTVPRVATALYNDSVLFTSYGSLKSQWCRSSNTNILHYGLKFCVDAHGQTAATQHVYRVDHKVFVQLRNAT